jgi:hypothetical protein
MKQAQIFTKTDSEKEIPKLVDLAKLGVNLVNSRLLSESESERVSGVVEINLTIPDNWRVKFMQYIIGEWVEKEFTSFRCDNDWEVLCSWDLLNDQDISVVHSKFFQPYRLHSMLSVQREYRISFQSYTRDQGGDLVQLPPMLVNYGKYSRPATKEEIRLYRSQD